MRWEACLPWMSPGWMSPAWGCSVMLLIKDNSGHCTTETNQLWMLCCQPLHCSQQATNPIPQLPHVNSESASVASSAVARSASNCKCSSAATMWLLPAAISACWHRSINKEQTLHSKFPLKLWFGFAKHCSIWLVRLARMELSVFHFLPSKLKFQDFGNTGCFWWIQNEIGALQLSVLRILGGSPPNDTLEATKTARLGRSRRITGDNSSHNANPEHKKLDWNWIYFLNGRAKICARGWLQNSVNKNGNY